MKALLFVFLLFFPLLSNATRDHQPAPLSPPLLNSPPDNWGGARSHLLYSTLLGTGANLWLKDRPIAAFSLCLAPGLAREWYTRNNSPEPGYRKGLFSRNDLLMNAAGCGLGYFGAKGVRALISPRSASVFWVKEF